MADLMQKYSCSRNTLHQLSRLAELTDSGKLRPVVS
jgi:hypothetical protein